MGWTPGHRGSKILLTLAVFVPEHVYVDFCLVCV